MSQYTPPINQTQTEDPFEGSVHSFDNLRNTRDFGARFLHPHVVEGVGPAGGGTFPLLDRTWNDFSSPFQYPATESTTCKSHTFRKQCAKMNLCPTILRPVLPSARLKAIGRLPRPSSLAPCRHGPRHQNWDRSLCSQVGTW